MNKNWGRKEIAYQIYPKSFNDSNGDGIGDIKGIISKLDYFKYLGITLLWIGPVYKSPMIDNGYDIEDYYNIDPQFGTIEDIEELINEAKKRDIKIIMDLVINHTSDKHKWFQEALKDKNSKYRDYYIIRKGKNHKAPNNWRSLFGGPIWEEIGNTNEFYLHTFTKEQPDLNWENPKMREEIYKMINWWLEKGIAGFRLDAINCMKKSDLSIDGEPDASDGLCNCLQYVREIDGIEKYYQEMKAKTFDLYNCLTVTEAVGVDKSRWNHYVGKNGNFTMMFNFDTTYIDVIDEDWFRRNEWTKKEFKKIFIQSQNKMQRVGWQATFIENHDQPRAINKYVRNPEERSYYSKTMLAAMYFFLRGTPFIYQGQEIGMENVMRSTIKDFDDVNTISQYYRAMAEGYSKEEALNFMNLRSRDNARTPMQWSNKENAGFSTKKPWLKLNENCKAINVEEQIEDPDSVLNFYKKIIDMRKNSVYSRTLIYGRFKRIKVDDDEIIAYMRYNKHKELDIICNFSNTKKQIEFNCKNVILSNYDKVLKNTLMPYQVVVIEKNLD